MKSIECTHRVLNQFKTLEGFNRLRLQADDLHCSLEVNHFPNAGDLGWLGGFWLEIKS